MLNPLIPLSVEAPDLSGATNNFLTARGNKQRNALLSAENDRAEQRASQEEQQFMLKDLAQDSLVTKELLASDPKRAMQHAQSRVARLQSEGRDSSHSEAFLQRLQAGDIAGANSDLDAVIGTARQSGLLSADPSALTTDQLLRSEELRIKKDRLDHDRDKDQRELAALRGSVDSLDLEADDKAALKKLPSKTLEKIISQELSPTNKGKKQKQQKELDQAKNNALEVRDLASELLNHPGRKAATGGSSLFPSRPGGKAKDFEVKHERLSSLLTVENLDKMTGVLSESDIAILKSAAAGLDLGQSEEAFEGELSRIMNKMDEKLNGVQASEKGQNNSFTSSSGVQFTVE